MFYCNKKTVKQHKDSEVGVSIISTQFLIYKIGLHLPKLWFIKSNKKCTQRAQTSADPEDPDFGLWTPGSEAW